MPGTYHTLGLAALLQSDVIPRGTRIDVFSQIYWVFLVLGTIVGVVVIGYMLYNAYKYRAEAEKAPDAERPTLGELPRGSGGGRKLFLSFSLSAIIVISLIAWTYGTLLFVEGAAAQNDSPAAEGEPIEITVEGFQFGWRFIYTDVPGHENGVQSSELVVPKDRMIRLNVTSTDVWHNFGVPGLRVKADAIPGQYTDAWFIGDEEAEYTARCYELCGAGHTSMQAPVEVTDEQSFDQWYEQQAAEMEDGGNSSGDDGNSTGDSGSQESQDDSHAIAKEAPA